MLGFINLLKFELIEDCVFGGICLSGDLEGCLRFEGGGWALRVIIGVFPDLNTSGPAAFF